VSKCSGKKEDWMFSLIVTVQVKPERRE